MLKNVPKEMEKIMKNKENEDVPEWKREF